MAGLIVLLVLALLIWFLFFYKTKRLRDWEAMLTFDEYVSSYPEVRTAKGIKCCKCGSASLHNWGLDSAHDHRRYVRCIHCDTPLYRIARGS